MCNGVVKRYVVLAAVGIFSACANTAQKAPNTAGDPLVEWHFVGANQVREMSDLTLAEIFSLPETLDLGRAALDKFSSNAVGRFASVAPGQARGMAGQVMKPFLIDLARVESSLHLKRGKQGADWFLALKLPDDRYNFWSTNLAHLAAVAKLEKRESNKEGWTASGEGYSLAFARGGEWTLLHGGTGTPAERRALFEKEEKALGQRKKGQLLALKANLPALAEVFNEPKLAHAPAIDLVATERAPGIRSEMLLDYPTDLGIKPEKWNPPTDTIRDPIYGGRPALIGFTAIQGLQNHFQKSEALEKSGPEKVPNQLYIWSHHLSPFSLMWAADVGNPATVISNFTRRVLPGLAEGDTPLVGNFQFNTNTSALTWSGLPVVVPYARPADGNDTEFLTGGFFPTVNVATNPAPPELFAELKKKNLVYYEWEITQPRIEQWRPFWQLNYILREADLIPLANSPSDKWLQTVAPKLGNTVTEVTLENPRRLKMVRQSHTGFNALELVLLSHYLDEKDLKRTSEMRREGKPPAPGAKRTGPAPRTPPVKSPAPNPPAGKAPAPKAPALPTP